MIYMIYMYTYTVIYKKQIYTDIYRYIQIYTDRYIYIDIYTDKSYVDLCGNHVVDHEFYN